MINRIIQCSQVFFFHLGLGNPNEMFFFNNIKLFNKTHHMHPFATALAALAVELVRAQIQDGHGVAMVCTAQSRKLE